MKDAVVLRRDRMTSTVSARLDNSNTTQCKVIFDKDSISIPTSFMVLPYELKRDSAAQVLVIPSQEYVELATNIGRCLLDINKATARLSFWLIMHRKLNDTDGDEFKVKLRDWLKRARSEKAKPLAYEMVQEIDCGTEYLNICREVLEKEDCVSCAKAFIKDPMAAATEAVNGAAQRLVGMYSSTSTYYFYLIDECRGVPVCSSDGCYPLQIKADPKLLTEVFLPFMNVTLMAMCAVDKMPGLTSLLGLPLSLGVPEKWRGTKSGLVHCKDQPESVAAFGLLQRALRDQTSDKSGSEISQLETFFSEHDPIKNFSGLQRLSDGSDAILWASEDVMDWLRSRGIDQAKAERRELEAKNESRENIQEQFMMLYYRRREMRQSMRSIGSLSQCTQDTANTEVSTSTSGSLEHVIKYVTRKKKQLLS